jgi:hypothetical protein
LSDLTPYHFDRHGGDLFNGIVFMPAEDLHGLGITVAAFDIILSGLYPALERQ